jgi:hypothetical protein
LPLFLGGARVAIGPRAAGAGTRPAARDAVPRVRGRFGAAEEPAASSAGRLKGTAAVQNNSASVSSLAISAAKAARRASRTPKLIIPLARSITVKSSRTSAVISFYVWTTGVEGTAAKATIIRS